MALIAKTVEGAFWTALGRWGQILIGLVTVAVMARWLGPEIYGLYALAMAAVWLGDTVCNGGLAESLVQKADLQPRHTNAIVAASVFTAVAYCAVLALAAPAIGRWMNSPEVEMVLPALSAALLFNAIAAAPAALLRREMKFAKLASIESVSVGLSSLVGIGMAIAGAGVWALVVMTILRAVLRAAGVLRATSCWPTDPPRWADFRELWLFNRSVLGLRLLQYVDKHAPTLMIGAILGQAAVGYFTLAWNVVEQIQRALVEPMSGLAMSAAAKARTEPQSLRPLMLGAAKFSSLIACPAFVGVAAIAPTAITFAFGAEWGAAVVTLQVLALSRVQSAIGVFNGGVLRGLGRPDLQLRVLFVAVGLTLILTPIAAHLGIAFVACMILFRGLVIWPLLAGQVEKIAGIPARDQGRAGVGPLVAALVMGCAVISVQAVLEPVYEDVVLLIAAIAMGVIVYATAAFLIVPDTVRMAIRAVGALARRDRRALVGLLR